LERKAVLKDLLKGLNSDIHYVPFRTDLEKAFEEVVQKQREGLILKRLDSGYEGSRSWDWLKVKNWRHTVCQVAGYTPGKNSRSIYFGSLVLVKDGKFVGHAGSGFNEWELRTIKKALDESQKTENPFDIGEPWTAVKTDLQIKAKYYKITDSGVMRFPVFEELA
jgi:bifunctional non-homologous end joining protein LigD